MKQMIKESVVLILIIMFLTLLFITLPIKAKEREEPIFVNYQQAGCNMTRYLLMNIEADEKARDNFEMATTGVIADEIIQKFNERQAKELQIKKDIELLAHLIWNEVGILGEEAMYCCGSVVLNRVDSDIYPDTIYGVIYQKGQYEITWNGMINRKPIDVAYEIAEDLVRNGKTLPDNVLFQAEFMQGNGVYKRIGNTYFCYL